MFGWGEDQWCRGEVGALCVLVYERVAIEGEFGGVGWEGTLKIYKFILKHKNYMWEFIPPSRPSIDQTSSPIYYTPKNTVSSLLNSLINAPNSQSLSHTL